MFKLFIKTFIYNTNLYLNMLLKKLISIYVVTLMLFGAMQIVNTEFTSNATNNGTFILGTTEDEPITDQNPLTASGLSGDILGITYADSLGYVFNNNGTVIPWSAHSWSITNNGKTITFNLVHNAYWMDGTNKSMQFTAKDVIFTFNVIKSNSTLDVNNLFPEIENISTPNNFTVVFTLQSPNPTIFDFIASQTIIPAAWEKYEPNISSVGSYINMKIGHQLSLGPMILTNIGASSVTLVKNPYFFMGSPHFSKEIIDLFESSSSMVESLETGAIDATYVDPNNLYSQINSYPGLRAVAFKTAFNLVLWFNDNVAPYNNTDFRIGLSYAINDTLILNKAEDKLGGPVNSGGLPWSLSSYYNSTIGSPTFNYTMANNYFVKSGIHLSGGHWEYKNGTTVVLNFVDLEEADWDAAMSMMQSELSADNFTVNFKVVPTEVWDNDIFSTENYTYASFFNFGPLLANPWFALWAEYSYNGYWNFEKYNNATVNNLFNVSKNETFNSKSFNSTLYDIQSIIASQMPTVQVMGAEVYYAYAVNSVGGFYPDQQLISPLDSLYAYTLGHSSRNIDSTIYIIIGISALIFIAAATAIIMRRRKIDE